MRGAPVYGLTARGIIAFGLAVAAATASQLYVMLYVMAAWIS